MIKLTLMLFSNAITVYGGALPRLNVLRSSLYFKQRYIFIPYTLKVMLQKVFIYQGKIVQVISV